MMSFKNAKKLLATSSARGRDLRPDKRQRTAASRPVPVHIEADVESSLRAWLSTQSSLSQIRGRQDIETAFEGLMGEMPASILAKLRGEFDSLFSKLETAENLFLVISLADSQTVLENLFIAYALSKLKGDLWPQNESGDNIYFVYDEGGRMEAGARYSRTTQGGAYHTDGVNQEARYDFIVLSCLSSGLSGGESILLDGNQLLRSVQTRFPADIPVLCQPIHWDSKGTSGNHFMAPILRLAPNGNLREWLYLRPYIEDCYRNRGEPIPRELVTAMDHLDSILYDDLFERIQFTLKPGQLLICNDRQLLHGRTAYQDRPDSITIDDFLGKDRQNADSLKRTLGRLWISLKRESSGDE